MSTDARIEEHWIGEAILPRPRRAPKLPALPVPHAPTCSRGNAALAAHAQNRDSARHPGDRLSTRQNGRDVVDQQARNLTQPAPAAPKQRMKATYRAHKVEMLKRTSTCALLGNVRNFSTRAAYSWASCFQRTETIRPAEKTFEFPGIPGIHWGSSCSTANSSNSC